MFGYPIRNVFRSRWHAAIWAGFVLLTAYCTVPALDGAGKQAAAPKADHHANPWKKGSAKG